MPADYSQARRWRNLAPSYAHERPACVLCQAPTDLRADCDRPEGEAWFVPVCRPCFDRASAPEPEPREEAML